MLKVNLPTLKINLIQIYENKIDNIILLLFVFMAAILLN
jgi:hypothetical protein